jgi:hypothetical protein
MLMKVATVRVPIARMCEPRAIEKESMMHG